MKKKLFLGLAGIIYLLLFLLGTSVSKIRPSQKSRLVDQVEQDAVQEIKKETGLLFIGEGAQMMHEIEMLALRFQCFRPISVEEGRALVTNSVDIFLRHINQNEEIRPYLSQYPFTDKNIDIAIFVYQSEYKQPPPGDVSIVSARRGKVSFTSTMEDGKFVSLFSEPFEEAQAKVAATKAVAAVLD